MVCLKLICKIKKLQISFIQLLANDRYFIKINKQLEGHHLKVCHSCFESILTLMDSLGLGFKTEMRFCLNSTKTC